MTPSYEMVSVTVWEFVDTTSMFIPEEIHMDLGPCPLIHTVSGICFVLLEYTPCVYVPRASCYHESPPLDPSRLSPSHHSVGVCIYSRHCCVGRRTRLIILVLVSNFLKAWQAALAPAVSYLLTCLLCICLLSLHIFALSAHICSKLMNAVKFDLNSATAVELIFMYT